jgi:hypothetical protein
MVKLIRNILHICVLLASCNASGSYLTASPELSTEIRYYVSVNGSDFSAGTSRDQAWRTIQKAASTMIAGDSVTVLAGTYDERVNISVSGSPGTTITYEAEGQVIHKGFTVRADYITIRGFEVTDTPDHPVDGIGFFVEGSHCIIEDNYVHDATRGGILIYAEPGEEFLRTDSLVQNNRLYRNAMYGIQVSGRSHLVVGNDVSHTIQYHPKWNNPPEGVDADGMRFFGSGHIFRNNYIHDITFDDPENIDPHIDCWQTWTDRSHEVARDILFESNICENLEFKSSSENGFGFKLAGGANNLTIRNNIIKAFGGLRINGTGTASHLFVYNNLFISDPEFQSWSNAIDLVDAPYAFVENNIFYDQGGGTVTVRGENTGQAIDYNLAFNSDGSQPFCIRVNSVCQPLHDHDLWGVDPLFVKPRADDFHLLSNSPAIDAGIMLDSVAKDFDGFPRPIGPGFDIGAYEYHLFRIDTYPLVVQQNEELIISISYATTGQPITITSMLPSQLDYSSSSSSCITTVNYSNDERTITVSGNPPAGSNCDLQIKTIVNVGQKEAIFVSATIDYGFTAPQDVSRTVILNGFAQNLPSVLKIY